LLYFRYFENLKPPNDVVFEEVACLRTAIDRYLKSKGCLPVTVLFRDDVFQFLFKGKGRSFESWQSLDEKDIPQMYFPDGWDVCFDSHGQGTKIYFPIKVRHFVTMSPKKFKRATGE